MALRKLEACGGSISVKQLGVCCVFDGRCLMGQKRGLFDNPRKLSLFFEQITERKTLMEASPHVQKKLKRAFSLRARKKENVLVCLETTRTNE
jgi:hypothetical protein